MAFDGIVTKCIVNELNKNIVGAKIDKVYEPTRNDIVLGLYCNGKNYALNICTSSNNCRLHITTHSKPNPKVAPNFCMLLRKHLIGSKIISIESMDLERTVIITLETYNEENEIVNKKLIVEIIGNFSNVILLNSEGNIVDCLHHFERPRRLLPTNKYEFISNCKKSIYETDLEAFINHISLDKSLDKQLSDLFTGISMSFVQNTCKQLKIDINSFNKNDLEIIYNHIQEIIHNPDNCVCESTENDYYIDYSNKECNTENLNINFFIDDFYHVKEEKENFVNLRNDILKIMLKELKKYTKRLGNIDSKLDDCKDMDKYKLYGELITANLYNLNKNQSKANVLNYYTSEQIEIPLDVSISPNKNAEKYFKKYNKLKNALDIVTKQKKETELELEYIQSLIYSINEANSMNILNEIYEEISDSFNLNIKTINYGNKENKNMPNIYNINGFEVLAGKNNKQNDTITRKAAPNDIWFHTQAIHGSHVILRANGKVADEDTLYKCATIAAKNSKAKNSSNVPVDYCFAKYVKKPSGAKPGMVVYTNYRTIFVK